MKRILIILMAIIALTAVGCSGGEQPVATTAAETETTTAAGQATEQLPKDTSLDEAVKLVAGDADIYFFDVRTAEEYAAGHVPNAELLPLDQLEAKIGDIAADKDAKIIVYCRSGNRSGQAQGLLNDIGYHNVCNAGGIINYSGEVVK